MSYGAAGQWRLMLLMSGRLLLRRAEALLLLLLPVGCMQHRKAV